MKSQSAMEYLMTYGWAILIIAVVLGTLYQLGVFTGGNFTPKAQPGNCEVQRTTVGSSLVGQCNGMLPEFVGTFPGSTYMISTVTNLPLGAASRTVTGWIYLPVSLSSNGAPFGHGPATTDNAFFPFINSAGNLKVTLFGTDEQVVSSVPIGTWFFIAEEYNGVAQSGFYGNAGQITSVSEASTATTTSTPFNIGANGGHANIFAGDIANVQLYNTSLSSGEIQALYLEGIGGAPVRPQNLTGWWPLNGNLNDYSGNNNNGQVGAGTVGFSSLWESGYTAP